MQLFCGGSLCWARTALGAAVGVCLLTGVLDASDGQSASVEDRVKGAQKVVVATARSVTARWEQNSFGDRLIVSRILLEVDETLKGTAGQAVWLDVDGGTLDGLTLTVSSLPLVHPGERGVFFLDAAKGNVHKPHLRGHGILLLDNHDLVRGSTLHLSEIRSKARDVGR